MHLPHARRVASAVALLALAGAPAGAEEWIGTAPGDWFVPVNWMPQSVPNSVGATAIIRSAVQGGSTITGGSFNLSSPITLGHLTLDFGIGGQSAVSMSGDITFDNGAAPATIFTTGTSGPTISGTVTLNSTIVCDWQGSNGNIGANISGTGGVIQDSVQNFRWLRLWGANSYTGPTIARSGYILVRTDDALGSLSTGTTVEADGTLIQESIFVTEISTDHVTILDGGRFWTSGGDWMSGFTLSGASEFTCWFDDVEGEVSGLIDGVGPLIRGSAQSRNGDVTNESILTISNAANSYSGDTILKGGGLRIPSPDVLGLPAGAIVFDEESGFLEGPPFLATSANTTIPRAVMLTTDGWLRAEAGTHATYSGLISGSSELTVGVEFIGDYADYSGTVELTGDNTYAGPTTVRSGTLLVSNSTGSATGGGDVNVLPGATLAGTGAIGGNVVVSELGAVAPGASAGTLTVDGDIDLGMGELDIELGGTNTGEFDQLVVGADVEATSATLNVSLLPGYTPTDGDTFTIILAAFVDGAFATENLPEGFSADYSSSDRVVLAFSGAGPCPGDITGDNIVDFSDLNALLVAFGTSGMDLPADLDGSGTVDFPDLNQVLVFFGTDCL